MTWWHYLLLVNMYLLLFYGFYALLLRNETFFQLNRLYLVAGAVLSFVIPVIQADWIKQLFITQRVQQTIYATIYHNDIVYQAKPAESLTFTLGQIFAVIYIGGAIFLCGRFVLQLVSVKKLINSFEASSAFSFFGKVKIDAELPGQQTILEHENVHVKQWHSADVLFIEAVMIINWFNPVVYFYRKAIKHVHEFIADQKAIERGTSKTEYALLLLSQTFGAPSHQLTNTFFNKSLLKQRIIMLNKDASKRRVLLKYGLSAPLFAAMLVLSAATVKNSKVIRIINKKTEQMFLINTLPSDKTAPIKLEPVTVAGDIAKAKQTPKVIAADTQAAAVTLVAKQTVVDDNSPVFSAVELNPEFPGGEAAFSRFLQQNIRYPKLAHDQNVQGKVYVTFVVDKDGELSDMKVLRDPGAGLGDEAMRVLEASPKWAPGIQNGRPVKVQYTVPINFSLSGAEGKGRSSDAQLQPLKVFGFAHATGGALPTADTIALKKNILAMKKVFFLGRNADSTKVTYMLNGKEISREEMQKLHADEIKAINVLSDEKNQPANYKTKPGVVAIYLKDTRTPEQ